jgi:hypothetical protein
MLLCKHTFFRGYLAQVERLIRFRTKATILGFSATADNSELPAVE